MKKVTYPKITIVSGDVRLFELNLKNHIYLQSKFLMELVNRIIQAKID